MALIANLTQPVSTPAPSGITKYTMGALVPEGPYMEPTIGQIWPR